MISRSSVPLPEGPSEFLPFGPVVDACEALGALAKRRVASLIGATPPTDQKPSFFTPGGALVVWTADLVERAPVRETEQRWLLVNELWRPVAEYGNHLWRSLEGRAPSHTTRLPVAQLGLADRRYVVLTGVEKALDLETGEWLEPVRITNPLERILYDLARLFTHRYQQVTAHAALESNAAGAA